jgi:hypothetical protein
VEVAVAVAVRARGVRARGLCRLQPRVHLHEVEAARVRGVGDELDRARALVGHRTRRTHRDLAQLLAEGGVDAGGGRLLEHLLVAPLHRAVALEEGDGAAQLVAEDLHLDVPRPRQVALDQEALVAEGGACLAPRALDRLLQILPALDDAHPLAPATQHGLEQHRLPLAQPALL